MPTCSRTTTIALLAAALAVLPGLVHAQTASARWPAKPITIVIPSTPGSASDVWSRLYTQAISENTDWKFLVDYKPGAGNRLGTAYVSKAAPDGYTLLIVGSSLTTAPVVYRNLTFDPVKSFAPVSLTSNGSSMLMVYPSLPIANYKDYVAYARANPGKISFGNGGIGTSYHLNSIILHHAMGVEVTYVPYKGIGDVSNALQSGEVQATVGPMTINLPFVKSGKLRALGVTTTRRSFMLPDLPTLQELCACEFEHNAWTGIVAPAGTPANIINMLSGEFIKAGNHPEVAKRLAAAGMESGGSTPEFFSRIIVSETERWRKLVRELNLNLQQE